MKPNLKLASSRDPAREKLAKAIAGLREAEAKVVANAANIEATWERTFAAQDAVEVAQTAVETARAAELAHAIDPNTPAPAMTARQAREAVVVAEEAHELIRSARKSAEDQTNELKHAVEFRRMAMEDARRDVVAADPAVRLLCEKFAKQFREFTDARLALDFLGRKGALPAGFERITRELDWPDLPGAKPWEAVFAELERDADAVLPV